MVRRLAASFVAGTSADPRSPMRAWNARATRMTPDQVADAQRRAREWDAAHPREPH